MSNLEDRLAALDVRDDAAAPAEGEKDAGAELFWPVDDRDPDAALYRENNDRERRLYDFGGASLLPWRRIIQRRGFGVWFVTEDGRFAGRQTNWLRVGDKVIPVAELRALAERAARLATKAEAA